KGCKVEADNNTFFGLIRSISFSIEENLGDAAILIVLHPRISNCNNKICKGISSFSLGKQKPSIKGSSILLEKLRSICVKKSLTTKLDIVSWLSSQAFSC